MQKGKLIQSGLHTAFWLSSVVLLTLLYGHFTEQYTATFWFVCLLMPVIMATVYFINYYLIPRYLFPARWFWFGLYFMYTLVVSVFLQLCVVIFSFIKLSEYRYQEMNPISSDLAFLVFGVYFIVFLATSIKLLRYGYKVRASLYQAQQKDLEIQHKLRESEFKLLQNQIHPHFLFNTLNNIYGLAREKSDTLPDSILQLSDMLDFLLYKSTKKLISLQEELKLTKDYLKLEELRFGKRLKVKTLIEVEDLGTEVPPLCLFTFIENAFKHSFSENSHALFLSYEVLQKGDQLDITVVNSTHSESITGSQGGIGLTNLRNRIAYLYPTFELKTFKDNKQFKSTLHIKLQKNPEHE